jgi:cell division septal protein FtsQ
VPANRKRKPSSPAPTTRKPVQATAQRTGMKPAATKTKRKPRRPVAWDRWFWVAAVVNVVAGLLYSPLTALRVVRVQGASPQDHVAIEQAMQAARFVPFAQASDAKITFPLLSIERVEGVSLQRNIFGRGVLIVRQPQVVAQVTNREGVYLTKRGELRGGLAANEATPWIRLPEDSLRPVPALASLTSLQTMADLVGKTRQNWPNLDWMVYVDEGGVLSLRMDKGPVVILGVATELDEKLTALAQILQTQEDLASKPVRITLTEPSAPAIAPLVFESNS